MEQATDGPNQQHGPKSSGQSSSSCNMISRMALNDNKAGMEGLDKEKINQIIYEASKDSKFFENEKKKEEQLEVRIKEQQVKISKISQAQLLAAEQEADRTLAMLEDERDLSHTIVHVDMDAFYAAVEMRDDPSLYNKPMAVGGMDMLSTSNYLARRFGVRAAMPGFIALKLCPDLVIVKLNFDKYTAVSREIRQVMAQYDPDFWPMSLDEAYLDLKDHLQKRLQSCPSSRMFILRELNTEPFATSERDTCQCDLNSVLRPTLICSPKFQDHDLSDEVLQTFLDKDNFSTHLKVCDECKKVYPRYACKVFGLTVEDAVLEIRSRIEQRTRLTASAGIAPNTMLAKVCSDKNKPNGQYHIKPDKEEIMSFIQDLPIRKISGIGKVTEKLLGSIRVVTCKDLFTQRAMLYHLFSPTSFQHFMRISAGIGSTSLDRDGVRKSISTERTFSDISDPKVLHQKCKELCQNLSEDMKDDKTMGKTLTLKIKTVEFEVKTRSYTLAHYTNDETTLFKAAQALLQTEIDAALPGFLHLRLMGVRMSKLCPEQANQISVVDMFKRMDRKDQGALNSEECSNSCLPGLQNKQEFQPNFYDVCTSKSSHLDQEDLDNDDDDESSKFSMPIEHTCDSEPNNINSHSWAQQSTPSKLLKRREPSSSKDVGMFKFIRKLDQNPQGKLQVGNKVNGAEEKPETESNCSSNGLLKELNQQSAFCYGGNDLSNSKEINNEGTNIDHQVIEITPGTSLSKADIYVQKSEPMKFIPCLDESSNSRPESEMISCPICKQQKLNWPLDQLNTHVDLCLSKQTVKNILRNERFTDKEFVTSKEKCMKRFV
ncbi:DNA polymerase kappa [Elysia marginata]|uniref:DNA polymerase kappa n=1 Tax=Elysia marginata TaxID=1093978 RepID=A0AAV4IBP2_9GAST|nr:DNA polymerase kappa [Elysia marginata]